MDRADPLRKPLLRFGSQWLQWSPRVFSESAPTPTTCPITFRGRAIPAGYSGRDFGGIAKVRFVRHPDNDVIAPVAKRPLPLSLVCELPYAEDPFGYRCG
jgi:hypothetical protein